MIRKACASDASRLAEILVFTKRMSYRQIFHNDVVSFVNMQVLPLALEYAAGGAALEGVYVYDDGIVRGMAELRPNGTGAVELVKLYVDSFFHGHGIGDSLLGFALQNAREQGASRVYLWALEKNTTARSFYERRGFSLTGRTMPEEGTPEMLVEYAISL